MQTAANATIHIFGEWKRRAPISVQLNFNRLEFMLPEWNAVGRIESIVLLVIGRLSAFQDCSPARRS